MPEKNLLFPNELAKKSPKRERRVWARHDANIESVCQPVAAETAPEPEMGWPGEIIEVSRGGIKISLERRFQPGTPLIIELPSGSGEPARLLQVNVIHATSQPEGPWVHGCKLLTKLSDEDLRALL